VSAPVQRAITAHEDLVYQLDWQASHTLPAIAPPLLGMTGGNLQLVRFIQFYIPPGVEPDICLLEFLVCGLVHTSSYGCLLAMRQLCGNIGAGALWNLLVWAAVLEQWFEQPEDPELFSCL